MHNCKYLLYSQMWDEEASWIFRLAPHSFPPASRQKCNRAMPAPATPPHASWKLGPWRPGKQSQSKPHSGHLAPGVFTGVNRPGSLVWGWELPAQPNGGTDALETSSKAYAAYARCAGTRNRLWGEAGKGSKGLPCLGFPLYH